MAPDPLLVLGVRVGLGHNQTSMLMQIFFHLLCYKVVLAWLNWGLGRVLLLSICNIENKEVMKMGVNDFSQMINESPL